MKYRIVCIMLCVTVLFPALLVAGLYPPAADEDGTTAVYREDPAFGSWASGYENYEFTDEVDPVWRTPIKALGMATGSITDICSLGRGGSITLTFDSPLPNRDGWDFAVFENGLSDTFLELAYVEVSSDGTNYVRFDCYSLTPEAVGAYGTIDTTDIDGFAGKYRVGYGTPFDLENLDDDPLVEIDAIKYIRIVDVVGDGNERDEDDNPIYDPYPTTGSAGFDLEAVGVLISEPTVPWPIQTGPAISGGCFIATAAFGSPLEWHVETLRAFRDRHLVTNPVGRAFVRLYYRFSPPAAEFIENRSALRVVTKAFLIPVVWFSSVMLHTTLTQQLALALFFTLFASSAALIAARCQCRERRRYRYCDALSRKKGMFSGLNGMSKRRISKWR
jgi:hypothetical protein